MKNTEDLLYQLQQADEETLGAVAKVLGPHIKNAQADVHFQAERITIPAGTVAGTVIPIAVTLDSRFSRCNGMVAYVIKSGANPDHQIAIRDNNRAYLERTSHKVLAANENTPTNERFLNTSIPAKSLRIYVETEITTTLAADLVYDVVFRLVNTK